MSPRTLRYLLAFGVIGALLVSVAALLFIAESVVAAWDRLWASHPVVVGGLMAGVVPLVALTAWIVWRLLMPGRWRSRPKPVPPPTEENVTERLEKAGAAGVDVSQAEGELAALRERRAAGESREQHRLRR